MVIYPSPFVSKLTDPKHLLCSKEYTTLWKVSEMKDRKTTQAAQGDHNAALKDLKLLHSSTEKKKDGMTFLNL